MHKLAAILLILSVLVLSACGGHKNPAVDKQAQRASAQAQKVVEKCASHANFLTKSGRTGFINCVAPPGHKAQFEQCALNSAKRHLSLSIKKDEANLTSGAATCLEKYR